MNYATIDKELLCIIATLREFHSMLFGADLHFHTDHQNILHVGDSSERHLHGFHMLMNMVLHCTMWMVHLMLLQTPSQDFRV